MKQRRKKSVLARIKPFGPVHASVKGPNISESDPQIEVSSIITGRRKWSRQQRWPEGVERRTYDPEKVFVISDPRTNRITTTRRKPTAGLYRLEGLKAKETERRIAKKRRTNKKLARQITNASKREKSKVAKSG